MFLKYEDMGKDLSKEVKKISTFLGVTIKESHLERIVADAGIKVMKSSSTAKAREGLLKNKGGFIRSGKTGTWKSYFTVAQNEWFDNKYKDLYKKLDIDVDY